MKRFFTFTALVLAGLFTFSQNLVPNPSFESYTSCPAVLGGISFANNWGWPVNHGGSSDIFHSCGGNGSTYGAPANLVGFQTARTGIGYAGFVTYFIMPNYREYIQVQLTTPLTAGVTYQVEAYVSLSDICGYAVDCYGFCFSNTAIGAPGIGPLNMYTPQVQNPAGNYMTDTTGWTRVFGSFVAAGGERYLTIGNFQTDAQTSFVSVGGLGWNYSYMDDVSVTPAVVLSAELGGLNAIWGNGPYVRLNWDTYTEVEVSHFELERSIGEANDFQTIEQIDASGGPDKAQSYAHFDHEAALNRPNFYRLKVVDTDGSVSYGQTVELAPYQPEDYLVRIFPNPVKAGQEAHLLLHLEADKAIQLSFTDLSGKQIRTQTVEGLVGIRQVSLSTEGLASGYYLLNYRAGNLSGMEKLVID